MKFQGRVEKRLFGKGSKSEHNAVYLKTPEGKEYVLRRLGGNAFRDPELDALVGKDIEGTGEVTDYTLILSDYKIA